MLWGGWYFVIGCLILQLLFLFLFLLLLFFLSPSLTQSVNQLVLHLICHLTYQYPHRLFKTRCTPQLFILIPMVLIYPNNALNHRLLGVRGHMIEWVQMVLRKVIIQPNPSDPSLIVSYESGFYLKSPNLSVQTLEPDNSFCD